MQPPYQITPQIIELIAQIAESLGQLQARKLQMKIILLSVVYLLATQLVFGQNDWQQFKLLSENKDTLGQRILLDNWEKRTLDDPELYVAYFNFFVEKSASDVLVLNQESIYLEKNFQDFNNEKAIEWINKGIDRFPNRLDMRFGKIYFLGLTENYEAFTEQIIQTVNYSAINGNQWLWSENSVLDEPKKMLLSSIQGYQNTLYATEQDTLLYNMQKIADAVLKVYPDDIESLSNLGSVYYLHEQYAKALTPLLTAFQLNPKDVVVINNIAANYKALGLNNKAEEYYRLFMKYGDSEAKKFAKAKVRQLNSN